MNECQWFPSKYIQNQQGQRGANLMRYLHEIYFTVSILPYTHRHSVWNTVIPLCHQAFNLGTGAANWFKKIKLLHCIGLVIYAASINFILIAVVKNPLQHEKNPSTPYLENMF